MGRVSNFYQKENSLFKTEGNIFFTNKHTLIIAKKIARHFGFKLGEISFLKMHRSLGIFHYNDCSITFMNGPSLRVIVHELAHLWQFRHNGWTRHSKPLLALMRRMFAFAKKKNWWIASNLTQDARSTKQ
jgi:hypothetical protein